MNVAAIRAAWERLHGTMGAVSANFAQARAAMTARIGALWIGLQSAFSSAMDAARSRAQALGDGIRAVAGAVQQRLASLWAGMQQKAGQLSGVAGGVARCVMSIVERLLAAGQRLWQSVQSAWSGLERSAAGLVEGAMTRRLPPSWLASRGASRRQSSAISHFPSRRKHGRRRGHGPHPDRRHPPCGSPCGVRATAPSR
jgi:hypothetical protein